MSDSKSTAFIAWRFNLLIFIILFIVIGLIFRVFNLAILDQYFLRHQGDERTLRLVKAHPMRGMIVDRNGYPLAVSTKVFSVWANPKEFDFNQNPVLLAAQLAMTPQVITHLINRYVNTHREFVYIKRGISPELASNIKALHLPGVYLQEDYKRYYPEAEVTSHVIGFTNIDDQGQEGVELAYNNWLTGDSGKQWVIKDRLGRIIDPVHAIWTPKVGRGLVLSIDRRLQYLAYRELHGGIEKNEATSGSAIVLDARTGEILAMVNQPAYDPNHKPNKIDESFRNRAVTDTFEPGSTIKAFSIVNALHNGTFSKTSIIDTYPGWMRVGHNVVQDEKNFGPLSLAEILQVSSNIGVTKLVLSSSPYEFWNLLKQLGFGEITGVGYPGEQSGTILAPENLGPFSLATLAFGYGISVTALQLARAYLVLANEGNSLPVTLLKLNNPPTGKPVIQAKVAHEMLTLLESVVVKGTGRQAQVPGYRVAGKTGTTKLVSDKGGYQKHRYTSSFIGIAPVSHPRLVVVVVIHDPKGKAYSGGLVAGPVFEKIMEGSLRILNIPPDANNLS